MATNTTRLLVMIIAINIVITLAVMTYDSSFDSSQIDTFLDLGDRYADDLSGEGSQVVPDRLEEEGSFGNAIRMGLKIFELFVKGLSPFPVSPNAMTDPIGIILAYGLGLFRVFMYMIIGLAVYDKLKNRKTD